MRLGVRLGIDVGSVRIGVSTCDPEGLIATPLCTLSRPAGPEQRAHNCVIERIVQLIDEHRVIEVIAGLPRSLSGEEGPAALLTRAFVEHVARAVGPVPVRLIDERLTTVDAHRVLRESGVPGRKQRRVVDQAAAVFILQAALDQERRAGHPPGELVTPGRRKPRAKDRTR